MVRVAGRTLFATVSSAVLAGGLLFGHAASAQSQARQPAATQSTGSGSSSGSVLGTTSGSALGSRSGAEVSPELYLTGNEIRRIQEALIRKGEDVGPVDGTWGPQSQTAVRNFQQKQRLAVTGDLNRETLQALGVDLTGPAPTSGFRSAGTAGTPSVSEGTSGPLDRGVDAPLGTGTGVLGVDPGRTARGAGAPAIGSGGSPGTSGPLGAGAAGLPPNIGSPGTDAGSGTTPPLPSSGSRSLGAGGGSLGASRSLGSGGGSLGGSSGGGL
jgi:peptidoglycan hydrolase-like protein with peptidoglycan-binding domain